MPQHQLDKKTKRTLFLIMAAIALIVILIIRFMRSSNDIYYDIDSTPLTLDPQLSNTMVSDTIVKNTFEGLMKKNEYGNVIKGVASEYHVSDDGLTYTFKITSNAVWADKTRVTAHDFVFAFRRLLDPATKSPTAFRFSNIKGAAGSLAGTHSLDAVGIKAIEDDTIQFVLGKADNTFLSALTLPAAMPCNEAFFNATNGAYGMSGKNTLCNGPLLVKNVTPDESITLGKNTHYRTGDQVNFDNALFIVHKAEDRISRFEKGTTDLFFYQSPESEDDLPKNYSSFQTKTWVLLFNSNSEEFKKLNNRKAFVAGIPQDLLNKRLPFSFSPAKTLYGNRITLGNAVYSDLVDSVAPSYGGHGAKSFLNLESGQANQLTLLVKQGTHSESVATEISQTWQKTLSVFVGQEAVSEGELLKRVQDGEFTFAIVPVSDFISARESSVSTLTNSSIFPNSTKNTMEDLRKDFLASNSTTHQKEVLTESEKILYDNVYLYPLYYETEYFSTSNEVRNITYLSEDNVIDLRRAKK